MDDSVYELGYPPNNACARLTALVQAVCPADGVSIGRWDDKATWRLDAKPEASPEQVAAAAAEMAAFDPWAVDGLELGADLLAAEAEAGPRTYDEATEEYFADEALRASEPPSDGPEDLRNAGGDESGDCDPSGDGRGTVFGDGPDPSAAPIDADFGELAAAADFIAIEGQPDDIAVEEPEPSPQLSFGTQENLPPYEYQTPDNSGGVAYFGDNIHTIKLAKMGRLSQIARAAKEALQAGWTLAEFASLQNLVVRIDRGEAPDDPEARARFMAISDRSAAMARVDAYREQREGELEEADRPGIEAFDPESGWP